MHSTRISAALRLAVEGAALDVDDKQGGGHGAEYCRSCSS
jgi:hypothetical protein